MERDLRGGVLEGGYGLEDLWEFGFMFRLLKRKRGEGEGKK